MSTPSNSKHTIKHKDAQPRQKRFKVGKACFTCRVKKIKCDGLQPCMQCKARSRPCSFSKDGITDSNDEHEEQEENSNNNSPASSPFTSPIISNQQEITPKKIKSIDNSKATEILNRLCKISPGEGREGKWEFDMTFYKHTFQQSHKQVKVELPTKSVQQHLIQLYFKNCYSTFPIIPKRLFHKHYESTSTKLLTSPILLLMIFAHGAQYQQKSIMDADEYFQKAKSLLEEELNYPSFSTTIALTLMSLYESPINQSPSMYSSMAFQMSFNLGLMRNYNGEDNNNLIVLDSKPNNGIMNGELMELKKRICWACYYLDKIIHIQSGQPWIIRSKDIELDMPLLQPGDDITEHEILEGFVATIKLWQIAERILQPQSLQQIGQPVIRTHSHDQMSLNNDNELLHWLRSLPLHLQWTPLVINSTPPTPDPPSNPLICQIHLIYNLIELYVLKPYATSTVKSIHQRSIAIATNITRLISTLADNPSWIFNMNFTLNSLFESTKFHLKDCGCISSNLARHARYMFQRSMQTMKTFLLLDNKKNSITNNITKFLTCLDQELINTSNNVEEPSYFNHQTEMSEDDIMTPFVLGSLNSRHGAEEERQQWSKLDYFANGLINPPTVKSKANLYYHPPSSSNTAILTATPTFNPPSISMYHHSATASDNIFQSSWRATMTSDRYHQYARFNNANPLNFLSSEEQHAYRNLNKSSSPVNNNSPKPPQQQQSFTQPAELLLSQATDQSDIAALVAQIRDNNKDGGNSSSNTSDTNQDDWNTTSSTSTTHNNNSATPNTTTTLNNSSNNNNDDLFYSLLSDQHSRPSDRLPERQTQSQNRQQQQQYNNFTTYPYTNVGLGIYASAHQHHNDVIRQHLPTNSTTNTTSNTIIVTTNDDNQ